MRRWRPMRRGVLAVGLLGLASVAGCASGPDQPTASNASTDMPVYETLGEAADAADVVVVATVTDERQRVDDDGGNDDDVPGAVLEQLVTTVDVERYLRGDGPPHLQVVQPAESEATASPGSAPLQADAQVVLALVEQTAERAPSVHEQIGTTWAPVSLDYGIAEVTGEGGVEPRIDDLPETTIQELH